MVLLDANTFDINDLLNPVTLYSLGFVVLLIAVALVAARVFAPHLSSLEKAIFVWYCYDGLTHLLMEASFVWMSITGTVATNKTHPMAAMWQEYGKADTRWLHSDPCVVSVESITVWLDGPLCILLLYAMAKNKPYRHFWQIVLCVAEIYGGWMTFAPEWLIGSPALNTANPLYLWLYLWFFNGLWVLIPALLLWQSYVAVTKGAIATAPAQKKRQ